MNPFSLDPWHPGHRAPRPARGVQRLVPVEPARPAARPVPVAERRRRWTPHPPPSEPAPAPREPLPAPPEPAPVPPEPEPAPRELVPAPSESAPAPSAPIESMERLRRRYDEELDKAKARIEREAQQRIAIERKELLRDMLEVVDDLDRALAAADGDNGVAEGVALVRERFLSKLRGHGVEPVADEGARFDPARHEALTTAPVDRPEQDGAVVAVHRRGYVLDGELLRPAQVIVGRLQAEA